MKKAGVAMLVFLVVAGVVVTILFLVIPDLAGKLSAGLRGDSGEPLSGGKPASYWLNELRGPDAGLRQEAAYNLMVLLADERHREALAPKAVPPLIAIVRNPDEDPTVRRVAVAALTPCTKHRDDLVPVFLEALNDSSNAVRQQGVLALGESGCKEPKVMAALMEALLDEDVAINRLARSALVKLAPESIPRLIEMLGDDDNLRRHRAGGVLFEIGPPAKPHLTKAISDGNSKRRIEARTILDQIRQKEREET